LRECDNIQRDVRECRWKTRIQSKCGKIEEGRNSECRREYMKKEGIQRECDIKKGGGTGGRQK
jgi:hypothetical protein